MKGQAGRPLKLREIPFENLKVSDRVIFEGQILHISELFPNRSFVICRSNGTGEILLNHDKICDPAHHTAKMGEIIYLGAA